MSDTYFHILTFFGAIAVGFGSYFLVKKILLLLESFVSKKKDREHHEKVLVEFVSGAFTLNLIFLAYNLFASYNHMPEKILLSDGSPLNTAMATLVLLLLSRFTDQEKENYKVQKASNKVSHVFYGFAWIGAFFTADAWISHIIFWLGL